MRVSWAYLVRRDERAWEGFVNGRGEGRTPEQGMLGWLGYRVWGKRKGWLRLGTAVAAGVLSANSASCGATRRAKELACPHCQPTLASDGDAAGECT